MIDFRALCRKYRIPIAEAGEDHHVSGGSWLGTSCPFCAGGKYGFHLGFSTESGAFNCWRCGALRFWDVIPALLRVSRSEAGQIVGEFQTTRRIERKIVLRQKVAVPPPNATSLLPAHKRYLESRRYDPEALVGSWGLLGTGSGAGKWSWRIVIPIHNGDDRIVAYQGRAIADTVKPKYKMTDDEDCLEDPKGFVYGLNKVPGDTVVIVEGVPGVWRLGPGTVATFGVVWHKQQLARLRRFRRRFVMYDPEPMAQKKAQQLAAALSLFPGETEILSGFTCDPGDFSDKRAEKIRREIGL